VANATVNSEIELGIISVGTGNDLARSLRIRRGIECAGSKEHDMQKILIVEDEEDLADGLEVNLSKEGYEVLKVAKGGTVVNLAIKKSPDLILLDIVLPDISGFDVCRELRQKGLDVPIIMLTGKDEEIDRVVGLEIGADDYVTKPFSLRELLARIRVHLRHAKSRPHTGLSRYHFGEVEIDFEKFVATRKAHALDLTPKEFEILRLLITCRGEVVTRDRLLNEIWGFDSYPTTRTVDNHILKLRKKVEEDPSSPQYILSIYGEGYQFVG